jgi:DNA repair protein RadC
MNTSPISLIAQLDDCSSRPGTGEEVIAAAREQMARRIRRGTQLASEKVTPEYLSLKLGTLEREVFAVMFLDNRHTACRRLSSVNFMGRRIVQIERA